MRLWGLKRPLEKKNVMDVESQGRVFLHESLRHPTVSLMERVATVSFYPRFFVLTRPGMVVSSSDIFVARGFIQPQPFRGTCLSKGLCGSSGHVLGLRPGFSS